MATITNTNSATLKYSINIAGKSFSVPDGGPYSGPFAAEIETVIPAGTTNKELDITFPHTGIQIIALAADQSVTVKNNSSTTPTETFNLSGKSGVLWGADFPVACPFATDVTKMFVTNSGTIDARLHFAVLWSA